MKKLFILSFLFLLITACETSESLNKQKTGLKSGGSDIEIIIIDNCQYIKFTEGYSGYMAHKGNCNNTIHIYTK